MSTSDPTKRILSEIGEPEEFFGFAFSDLKILLPAVFVSMLVVGNSPPGARLAGWGGAVGIVLGTLVLIYASPGHQTTQAWLKARMQFLGKPSVITLSADGGDTRTESDSYAPEINYERDPTDPITTHLIAESLPTDRHMSRTQELTRLERFHVAHRAGERDDGFVFGAVQVHPANMALATGADWERAVNRLGEIVNNIEFPFQIYSTVTPVDPDRITAGYRNRLEDRTTDLNPEFRALLESYVEKFPREFARRGTSIREFYIIVPVSVLDVQRDVTSVNEDGILANLEGLSYIGGFVTALRASRSDVSSRELEMKQLAELNHRLTTIEDEFTALEGCSTTRISTQELAALLKDFWAASARTDDDPTPSVRTTPVVHREPSEDRTQQSAQHGGESP